MRQIILDTETTGIGPEKGHRIIEIGCIEMLDRKITKKHFHVYLNPDREVEEGAYRVHGISTEFLQDKPRFKDIADEFIQFIDGAELIIHNAPFDVGFINAELSLVGFGKQVESVCTVTDTLVMARKMHPGQRNSLDALCKRYDIDNSNRELHGALLDSEILASVYLAMTGGQTSLLMEYPSDVSSQSDIAKSTIITSLKNSSPVLKATSEEVCQHNDFIEFIIKKSGINLWKSDEPKSLKRATDD